MATKVRISRITVQLEAFADDGENLTPLNLQPMTYPAGDWSLFDLEHVRQLLQRQVDSELAAEAPPAVPAEDLASD